MRKKCILYFIIMLLSCCLVITTGCSDDDDDNSNNGGNVSDGNGPGTLNIVDFATQQIETNTFVNNDPLNLNGLIFNNTDNGGDPNANVPTPNG